MPRRATVKWWKQHSHVWAKRVSEPFRKEAAKPTKSGKYTDKCSRNQQFIRWTDICADDQRGQWLCLWALWKENYVINASMSECPRRKSNLPAGALKWHPLLMIKSEKVQRWSVFVKWRPRVSREQPAPRGTGTRRDLYFAAPGNAVSKSRIGAAHYTKYISHKSPPLHKTLKFSFFFFILLLEIFLSVSLSPFPFQGPAVLCAAGHSQRDDFHTNLSAI